MTGSIFIKVHQSANGAVKKGKSKSVGRTKGSISTRINAVVDALANPIKFILSEKQRYDSKFFNSFIKEAKDI